MSIRFTGGSIRRQTALNSDAITICGFAELNSLTGTFQAIAAMTTSGAGNRHHLRILADGQLRGGTDYSSTNTPTLATLAPGGGWFFWAIRGWDDSGTDRMTFSYRALPSGTMVHETIAQTTSYASPLLYIGTAEANNYQWSGQIEDVKVWGSKLTDGELQTESEGHAPVKSSPHSYLDFTDDTTFTTAVDDDSASNNDWYTDNEAGMSFQSSEPQPTVSGVRLYGGGPLPGAAPAATVPTAPTGLTVTADTGTTVTLNWTDTSSNEDGFQIYRKTSPGGTRVLMREVGAGVTTATISGQTPNVTYYWDVRAFNTAGASGYTAEVARLMLALKVSCRATTNAVGATGVRAVVFLPPVGGSAADTVGAVHQQLDNLSFESTAVYDSSLGRNVARCKFNINQNATNTLAVGQQMLVYLYNPTSNTRIMNDAVIVEE